jgi:hypothetical protein
MLLVACIQAISEYRKAAAGPRQAAKELLIRFRWRPGGSPRCLVKARETQRAVLQLGSSR